MKLFALLEEEEKEVEKRYFTNSFLKKLIEYIDAVQLFYFNPQF